MSFGKTAAEGSPIRIFMRKIGFPEKE